jgi:hypothetical protein
MAIKQYPFHLAQAAKKKQDAASLLSSCPFSPDSECLFVDCLCQQLPFGTRPVESLQGHDDAEEINPGMKDARQGHLCLSWHSAGNFLKRNATDYLAPQSVEHTSLIGCHIQSGVTEV